MFKTWKIWDEHHFTTYVIARWESFGNEKDLEKEFKKLYDIRVRSKEKA